MACVGSKKQAVQTVPENLVGHLLTPEYLGKYPTARLFGYARVSTTDQILDVQLEKLREAGVPSDGASLRW